MSSGWSPSAAPRDCVAIHGAGGDVALSLKQISGVDQDAAFGDEILQVWTREATDCFRRFGFGCG
ncbi:hypothetical protein [Amycolatopsis sp. FDAARGOS 1241]|uniref:hypothetical protein n=1 Tax=Amycolatopsis sp. FDAARGOS 1241 TaxID=2778070 RepID=UPI00194F8DE3|nr:hypothetical protein [Amycolatopsis sp. FDAARGOS 1241]QRP49067.1 hypothetical protein I6J71_15475 [Amycolatopsis sp. FDAARGOS 1241]